MVLDECVSLPNADCLDASRSLDFEIMHIYIQLGYIFKCRYWGEWFKMSIWQRIMNDFKLIKMGEYKLIILFSYMTDAYTEWYGHCER